MYYNALHAMFTLKDKYKFTTNLEDEKFRYFFYATLFLVSKFDNNDYFKCFLQKALKEEMNINYLCQTEFIILEEIRKIYYFSPQEICHTLVSMFDCSDDKAKIGRISENYNIFIEFALSEYGIYSMFDQFTMSLACLYITLKNIEEFALMHELVLLLPFLEIEKSRLMECVDFIESQLGCKDDEVCEEITLSKSTSCSSTSLTITSNKENVERRNSEPVQKKSHHKINKFHTVCKQNKQNIQSQKSQSSIPSYFCKMKRKLRTKSI